MTKMDIACTVFADRMGLDLVGTDTLEALNAGNEAIELLYALYYRTYDDVYGTPKWLEEAIDKLLKEWN